MNPNIEKSLEPKERTELLAKQARLHPRLSRGLEVAASLGGILRNGEAASIHRVLLHAPALGICKVMRGKRKERGKDFILIK